MNHKAFEPTVGYLRYFQFFIIITRTGKGQFSFQYQRKEMPKNVQTTT